jgi:hypothetical protein
MDRATEEDQWKLQSRYPSRELNSELRNEEWECNPLSRDVRREIRSDSFFRQFTNCVARILEFWIFIGLLGYQSSDLRFLYRDTRISALILGCQDTDSVLKLSFQDARILDLKISLPGYQILGSLNWVCSVPVIEILHEVFRKPSFKINWVFRSDLLRFWI